MNAAPGVPSILPSIAKVVGWVSLLIRSVLVGSHFWALRVTHHLNDIATIRHLIAKPIRFTNILRGVIVSPFEAATQAGRLQGLAETTHR